MGYLTLLLTGDNHETVGIGAKEVAIPVAKGGFYLETGFMQKSG